MQLFFSYPAPLCSSKFAFRAAITRSLISGEGLGPKCASLMLTAWSKLASSGVLSVTLGLSVMLGLSAPSIWTSSVITSIFLRFLAGLPRHSRKSLRVESFSRSYCAFIVLCPCSCPSGDGIIPLLATTVTVTHRLEPSIHPRQAYPTHSDNLSIHDPFHSSENETDCSIFWFPNQ